MQQTISNIVRQHGGYISLTTLKSRLGSGIDLRAAWLRSNGFQLTRHFGRVTLVSAK